MENYKKDEKEQNSEKCQIPLPGESAGSLMPIRETIMLPNMECVYIGSTLDENGVLTVSYEQRHGVARSALKNTGIAVPEGTKEIRYVMLKEKGFEIPIGIWPFGPFSTILAYGALGTLLGIGGCSSEPKNATSNASSVSGCVSPADPELSSMLKEAEQLAESSDALSAECDAEIKKYDSLIKNYEKEIAKLDKQQKEAEKAIEELNKSLDEIIGQ